MQTNNNNDNVVCPNTKDINTFLADFLKIIENQATVEHNGSEVLHRSIISQIQK